MIGFLLDAATLFLPWWKGGERFLIGLAAFVTAIAILAALLRFWPTAVACGLVALMLVGLVLLARAAAHQEARNAAKGWVAGAKTDTPHEEKA